MNGNKDGGQATGPVIDVDHRWFLTAVRDPEVRYTPEGDWASRLIIE